MNQPIERLTANTLPVHHVELVLISSGENVSGIFPGTFSSAEKISCEVGQYRLLHETTDKLTFALCINPKNPGANVTPFCNCLKTIENLGFGQIVWKLNKPSDGLFNDLVIPLLDAYLSLHYRFREFISDPLPQTNKLYLDLDPDTASSLWVKVEERIVISECINIARDLINMPANLQTPVALAESVRELAAAYGVAAEIFDEQAIAGFNMSALLAVAQGSPNPPRLIVLRHLPESARKQPLIALVGKGVTYDSGGFSLKRGDRMITMKHDMAGAAVAVAGVLAAARLKLPVPVIAVVAACDNLIGSNAYKPGDIIQTKAGKSVLITSTDAEGRLTLVDALQYAIHHEHADELVDLGTLTGAARRFFGSFVLPVMCNRDDFYAEFVAASQRSGETIWRFPIVEEMRPYLRSEICDYKNSTRMETGGAITAGMFLQEFVEDKPWAHFDFSGPSWFDQPHGSIPAGGTGIGVKTLLELLKARAAQINQLNR